MSNLLFQFEEELQKHNKDVKITHNLYFQDLINKNDFITEEINSIVGYCIFATINSFLPWSGTYFHITVQSAKFLVDNCGTDLGYIKCFDKIPEPDAIGGFVDIILYSTKNEQKYINNIEKLVKLLAFK